ncbi:hypothetical protein DSO57_1029330 [Entomophthora muscae]|uniref:Uncharacterized protein n=1 Tax=Entomophthora muscae TaxID=34485 RepID=A0ACC2T1A0_9FUNG|nr:hypothetical protein DSO57_1029330 [Entomophthora muscae]
MNHLIFSAVLTACLEIEGHQYNHQHGPFNKPPGKYFYKEPAQLNSSKKYSWPTLVLPHSTQSVAIHTCIYYVITYFAGNFGAITCTPRSFNECAVYPIVTALTGFQVANLVPYFAKILSQLLGLYTIMVCRTQVNCNTGKSPYELVYEHKPAIVSKKLEPWLSLAKKVPGNNDPHVQHAIRDQEDKGEKMFREKQSPYNRKNYKSGTRFGVLITVRINWTQDYKDQEVAIEVKLSNTYLIKGIHAHTELKCMHHDQLCLCKERKAQHNSFLPVPNAKLDQHQA